MKLPFLNNKKGDSDYYLALVLSDEKASSVILQESIGNLKKISSHEEHFPTSIEDVTLEEFINIIDKTISRAEEILPPNVETHKTVFGVKDGWIDKESKKIKKEYLDRLKKVCDALDLSPIGFMVTGEAITHLIQDEEGAPLSAVFAEIGKKHVTLSLLRGGQMVENISSQIVDSAPATVDKLLGHFTVPVLPARIVVFLNKHDERTSHAFSVHQWSKSLPFLHLPQVTILPETFDSRAVMFGAATQMGFTVLESTHEELPKPPAEPQYDNLQPVASGVEAGGDFGFVLDQEATSKTAEPEMHPHQESNNTPMHNEPVVHHSNAGYEQTRHHETEDEEKRGGSMLSKLPSFTTLKNIRFPKFGGGLKGLSGNKGTLKIIIPVLALIMLVVGAYLFYTYQMKATISLTVTPNMVNQDQQVTFSTSASNDFSKNVLAARGISASLDGEGSTPATGKKDVGEKAKGNITIYNNDSSPAKLNSGSELKANSGQIFITDKDVQIDAASGDIFSGTKPGTGDVSVTAKDLGTDGNIPSGTRFTVGSNSNLAARNDSALSGGTKKNVTVVSKNDLAKLRADLPKSAQSKAQDALTQQAESGETVLPIVGNATVQKEKFDKKEGDEATKVTLKASVVYSGMAYQNAELHDYAQTVLKSKYAQDVNVAQNSIKETVKNAKQKDTKSAAATLSIEAGLLPKINALDVIDNVKDKSLGKAKDALSNLPQVSKADITFSPPIPLLPNLFPKLPKQISVVVNTQ